MGLERIHLEILRAVHQHGSLRAAATSLYVTQSALSHSIGKLEAELGVAFWQREGRGLRWTQAGEYLLAAANRLAPEFAYVEEQLRQFAQTERGRLRIGMECHPCYQWLLNITAQYLEAWPHVDLDVKQKFQFDGIKALTEFAIDLLVTPDPQYVGALHFEPVFDYEQVLVVGHKHPLAGEAYIRPEQLAEVVLITYPVLTERLDIFTHFLNPAGILPRQHKTIESTEILLQLVASGRGVTAMPRWLVEEQMAQFPIVPIALGPKGIHKQIFLGIRQADREVKYIQGFLALAQQRYQKAAVRP